MVRNVPAVRVEGLSKTFVTRGGRLDAVRDVSFTIETGEVVGLLGPNGAGKTTTIKCLCTLIRPTGGYAEVGGFDVMQAPDRAVAQIAAVFEANRNLRLDLTARQNLQLYASLQGASWRHGGELADSLLQRFNLGAKRDSEVGKLSRGMQQKLALAAAMARETPILMVDEPTLGLDVDGSHEVRQCLREVSREGRTTLVSSHDMDVVQELCDRVIIIAHGRVVAVDSVRNLLNVFRTRAYRVRVAGPLDSAGLARLERVCTSLRATADDGATVLEAQLQEGGAIYQLVATLAEVGAEIERIDTLDPDLEQVYLKVVAGASAS